MNVSHKRICCMRPFVHKGDIYASVFSYWLKRYSHWFIQNIIIPNACVSMAEVLNDFEISLLCKFGSFVYIS